MEWAAQCQGCIRANPAWPFGALDRPPLIFRKRPPAILPGRLFQRHHRPRFSRFAPWDPEAGRGSAVLALASAGLLGLCWLDDSDSSSYTSSSSSCGSVWPDRLSTASLLCLFVGGALGDFGAAFLFTASPWGSGRPADDAEGGSAVLGLPPGFDGSAVRPPEVCLPPAADAGQSFLAPVQCTPWCGPRHLLH